MRTVTKFLHILILSLPFVVQAQQLQLTPPFVIPPSHEHYIVIERIASETDLFIGMLLLVECQVQLAEKRFKWSLEHNPQNEEARYALEILVTWPKKESMRLYNEAKGRKSTSLIQYYKALTCDPNNVLAAREVQRILAARK